MASSKVPQFTDFTIDILGRYMCNGLDEALHSIDKNAQRPDGSPQSDARPFNAAVIQHFSRLNFSCGKLKRHRSELSCLFRSAF